MNPPESADIARLVAEHHAWVYRAAYRLCGSVADAEDLTQQTFLTAQRALAQLRDPSAARGWLGAILRTGFLKAVRKRRPLSAESHDVDLHEFASPVPDDPAVDGETLQQALHGLSDDARLILTMFYFQELSYRQIADSLDVPIGTVMSRLSRAKEQLRRRLSSTECPPPEAGSTRHARSHHSAIDDRSGDAPSGSAPSDGAPSDGVEATQQEGMRQEESQRQAAQPPASTRVAPEA